MWFSKEKVDSPPPFPHFFLFSLFGVLGVLVGGFTMQGSQWEVQTEVEEGSSACWNTVPKVPSTHAVWRRCRNWHRTKHHKAN
eukprot:409017-Amphidinium_carterae.1